MKNLLLGTLIVLAAFAAMTFRPTILLADQRPKVELEELIPRQFGDWREIKQSAEQIINPQQTALLQKLYSQTLSRTYINTNGTVVMVSVAYGSNQSDGIALHYPEVCYPAQGFQLMNNEKVVIHTPFGVIPAKKLMTKLGNRFEPVTYWTTIGDKAVEGGIHTKLEQIKYGMRGAIPDGLIFRISSINREESSGHDDQNKFARDLVASLPVESRLRLAGLSH